MSMSLLQIATVLEPLAVFLLSVEAIKLDNISRLRKSLTDYFNRTVEFTEATSSEISQRPTKLREALAIVSVIVATPFAFATVPVALIEKHTAKGIIGIVGFSLWLSCYLINHTCA